MSEQAKVMAGLTLIQSRVIRLKADIIKRVYLTLKFTDLMVFNIIWIYLKEI